MSAIPTHYRRIRAILAGVLALLCLSSNGFAATEPDEFRKVSLQLKWFHSYQFAGYYAAAKMGFYADEGLDVEIRERDIKTTPRDDVLAGRADFGIADSSLILHRLKGDPLVMLAVIFQSSPMVLIALDEQGIKSPLDLVGKRVMYQRNEDDVVITAMFNEVGLNEHDFTYMPHNFNDRALLSGEVDAMSAYVSNQPYVYQQLGKQVSIINPANYGIDFYGDSLFTSEELLHESPDIAMGFRKASLRGWEYAIEHPEDVIEWIRQDYQTTKKSSVDKLRYEARITRRMIKPRLVPIGDMHTERFKRIADIYKEKGLAPTEARIDGIDYRWYFKNEENQTWKRNALITITVVFLFALTLLFANRRLNKLVNARTRDLMEANQAKTVFLANMSHELRTPLNSIIGFSNRVLKRNSKQLDERAIDALNTVLRNAEHLLHLINDMLDLVKIDAGKMEINLQSCDLHDVIQSCVTDLSTQTKNKSLTVEIMQPFAVSQLRADPLRLKQIIINLLSNAIKYSEQGTISIRVQCAQREREASECVSDRDYCKISVSDTGIGISESDQQHLFKRFEQFDEKTKSLHGFGSGLGLALVAEFAQMHGGYVEVESELGLGSCFSVFLPLDNPDAAKRQ